MRSPAGLTRARLEELNGLFGQMVRGWWTARLGGGPLGPTGVAFVTIVTATPPDLGEPFLTYAANAPREQVVQLLREMGAVLQQRMDRGPGTPLAQPAPARFSCAVAEPDDGAVVGFEVTCEGQPCGVVRIPAQRAAAFVEQLHREAPR